MKGCLPGEGKFAHLPANQTYEWYLAELEKMEEESKQNGEGDPVWRRRRLRCPRWFRRGRWKPASQRDRKGASQGSRQEGCRRSRQGWQLGLCFQSMRKTIKERLQTKVDWKKMLRYFVRTSQRADKRSTPRRLNKRFPKIHPGKRVRRQAKIAISIDQSGSVDDGMLAAFYSELDNLAQFAEFTVIPFDTEVAKDKVYVWKKGERRKAERVLHGGTCFDAPTRYVNEGKFDGHIISYRYVCPQADCLKVASVCG